VLTLRSASPLLTIRRYHIFQELDVAETPFCQFAQFCTSEAHHERVSFQTCNSPQLDILPKDVTLMSP